MKSAQNIILLTRRAQLSARVSGSGLVTCAKYNKLPIFQFRHTGIRSVHTGSFKDTDVLNNETYTRSAFSDVPGVKSEGEKMIIMFTCTVCDTRSARTISKQAYNQGIVMVRCECCKNRHLIADRMGVFEDSIGDDSNPGTGWDIQKYLAKEMGEKTRKITDENVFELTMEDIVGIKAASAFHNNQESTGDDNKKDDTK